MPLGIDEVLAVRPTRRTVRCELLRLIRPEDAQRGAVGALQFDLLDPCGRQVPQGVEDL